MATKTSIGSWLQIARLKLDGQNDAPGLSAEALLAHWLGKPRAWILAHPEAPINPLRLPALSLGLEALRRGMPLPYLTGVQEFYGLPFRVSPQVLIPRPETELLVEQAIHWLSLHPHKRLGADVGSGSGCIAITLAKHVPTLRMAAVDISRAALQMIQKNRALHRVQHRVLAVQANLLSPFGRAFDLICANLPYIPSHKLPGLAVARHEPRLALDGGPDGLDLVRALLASAAQKIHPGGLLLLEIEAGHGETARDLGKAAFPHAKVEVLPDLAGLPRLLRIELQD